MMRDTLSRIRGNTLIPAPVLLAALLATADASASLLLSEEGIAPVRSAEYVRTQSRNASMEADAVYYNPAGLSFLQNGGIYVMLNSIAAYTWKSDSLNMWGSQSDTFKNFMLPIQAKYEAPKRYLSSTMTALPSDLGLIFKRDNWSVFASASILRGQPWTVYRQSSSTVDRLLLAYNTVLASRMSQQIISLYSKSSMERKEYHIGATVGASYAFLDMISVSLSLRYLNIQSNTRINQTPLHVQTTGIANADQYQFPMLIDTDVAGHGMGLIVGFDVKPLDNLNIAARAEYYPPMVLDKRTNKFIANPVIAESGQLNVFCDSIWPLVINDRLNPNGIGNIFNILLMDQRTLKNISNKVRSTYPPSLSLGFSYRPVPALKFETSADLTFPRARNLDGRERDWKDVGFRVGQGIEWSITTWAIVSVGYSYHDFGLIPAKVTEYDDLLASHTVGGGCTFKPADIITLSIAGSYSFFTSSKQSHNDVLSSTLLGQQFAYLHGWNQTLSRDEWNISIGATFFFYPVAVDRVKKAEEHYWRGMSSYLSNDVDTAIKEFKEAKSYNSYYRDVDKKVRDLTELQKVIKKNIEQEQQDKEDEGKGRKGEDEK